MSRARGEGLRLLGGMLTGEPVAGREGGTSSLSLSPRRQGQTCVERVHREHKKMYL